jgi:hypothetical protein
MEKRVLTPYAIEQLGFYVYALRNPIDKTIFYVGKGKGSRVFDHANGVIDGNNATESEKIQTIRLIHEAGLQVESFIVQHGLANDEHAFQTESALYGILKLLDENPNQGLFTLTNLKGPPKYADFGLMSVEDVLALYGEPADTSLIPHNSMFIKPTELWKRGMSREALWEVTHGWWKMSEDRIKEIRYVFAVPNLVIRAVWEVKPEDWRVQGPGDRGWDNVHNKRIRGTSPRRGFESCLDVSESKFPSLINKSVEHTYQEGQGKRANVVYLDDQKLKELARQSNPREPFWNISLR